MRYHYIKQAYNGGKTRLGWQMMVSSSQKHGLEYGPKAIFQQSYIPNKPTREIYETLLSMGSDHFKHNCRSCLIRSKYLTNHKLMSLDSSTSIRRPCVTEHIGGHPYGAVKEKILDHVASASDTKTGLKGRVQ